MPPRQRRLSRHDVRSYLAQAEEFLEAARESFEAGRYTAATGLAIHAGISATDAVLGARLGRRSSSQDHSEAVRLLREAGDDGKELALSLGRLLPLKNRAEYDPDDVPKPIATSAVRAAERTVVIARRVVASLP